MATQAKRDYYDVLGVARTATQQKITNAFKKLVAEFRAAGKPRDIKDVEEIRGIVTAYRVLSNGEKRQHYDQFGSCLPGDTRLTADEWAKKELLGARSSDSGDAAAFFDAILAGL